MQNGIILFTYLLFFIVNEQSEYLRTDDMETKQQDNLSLWVFIVTNIDSPSILPSLLSSLLVIIPSVALLISLARKQEYELLGGIILCNLFVHLFMIKCVRTNPGIIPQIVPNRQMEKQLMQIPKSKLIDEQRRYLIQNQCLNVYSKFCYECRIFRPLRTIHCWHCNHCVQKYDHHCPWLSVCIGKFNYIYFMGYIISLCVLAFTTSAICLTIVIKSTQSNQDFTQYVIEAAVGIQALCFSIPLLRLVIYHFTIIKKKRTTNQDLKNIYHPQLKLPFDSCYLIERKKLFNSQTQYLMKKGHRNQLQNQKKLQKESQKMKSILMGSLNRQLNQSTDSSSSAVKEGNRYSITATERTSIFNYLLETE